MGAETFFTRASGESPQAAFIDAVSQARYDRGHTGYTGTIAEKRTFNMIPLPHGADPSAEAWRLIDAGDPRVDDKWGPAGCFDLGNGEYLFFGWASS